LILQKKLKLVKICFIASLAKFANLYNTSSRLYGGNHWMGTAGGDDLGLRFWHWARQWSCRRFTDFVISCSWSCWTVDELTNLELLTSQNF